MTTTFGSRLRAARESAALTQQDVVFEVGSSRCVSRWAADGTRTAGNHPYVNQASSGSLRAIWWQDAVVVDDTEFAQMQNAARTQAHLASIRHAVWWIVALLAVVVLLLAVFVAGGGAARVEVRI